MTVQFAPGDSWEDVTRELGALQKRIERLKDGSAMAQTMVHYEQRLTRNEEVMESFQRQLDEMPARMVQALKAELGRSA